MKSIIFIIVVRARNIKPLILERANKQLRWNQVIRRTRNQDSLGHGDFGASSIVGTEAHGVITNTEYANWFSVNAGNASRSGKRSKVLEKLDVADDDTVGPRINTEFLAVRIHNKAVQESW